MAELGIWIGVGLPIVTGVVTALALAFYAARKKSTDRWPEA